MTAKNGPHPLHRVVMHFNTLGVRNTNHYHVGEVEPGVVKREGINLASVFHNWWITVPDGGTAPDDLTSSDVVLLRTIAEYADVLLDAPIIGQILDIIVIESISHSGIPNECSYAVEWKANHTGHGSVGRTFLVGMPYASMLSGQENYVDPSYLDKVRIAYANLLTMLHNCTDTPGGVTLAIAHRIPTLYRGELSPNWSAVASCIVRVPRYAAQRRRRPHLVA